MDIGALNEMVTFQEHDVIVDRVGNHKTAWRDQHKCHANVRDVGGDEVAIAGTTVDRADVEITVRYCTETSLVTTNGYRIVFKDEIYDIVAVDHMGYQKKSLRFLCKKVRR